MSGSAPAPAGEAVRVLAPAKINPWLEVLARRPDGFHELDTWMLCLDLVDELELCPAAADQPPLALTVDAGRPGAADGCPADARNLAWRAVEATCALARTRGLEVPPLALHLTKRIPSEAGLGGGSADAAAAVLGAAQLVGLSVEDPALVALLAELGSDCAFFFAARATGAARCGGRGERVAPIDLPAGPRPAVVLVTPDLRVPTPSVFAALELGTAAPPPTPALDALLRGDPAPFCRLEAPARRVVPQLAAWRALFDEVHRRWSAEGGPGALAPGWGDFTLSGSGSSFFAFSPAGPAAEALRDELERAAKARDLGLRLLETLAPRAAGVERISTR